MFNNVEEYANKRSQILEKESSKSLGSSILLSDKEKQVNNILMSLKLEEISNSFKNPENYLAGQHFFKSQSKIECSKIFEIIKKMPKGSSLHSHDTALVSFEYLFSLTYEENLYGCLNDQNKYMLRFFNENSVPNDQNWKKISDLRREISNFDDTLKKQMTLIVDDPYNTYTDINKVWQAFFGLFIAVEPLVCYKPVFEMYFYQSLKELHEDNVSYLEFRGLLPTVYDLNGKNYNQIEVCGIYYEVLQQFLQDFPTFYGCKFIFAPLRCVDNNTVKSYTDTYNELKTLYPDFIAGFDLVGQEDLGEPLLKFMPELIEMFKQETTFFFHAGESNWFGETTDENLIDAVLLNTIRIGHGFAILKHPEVLNIVRQKSIAIEICPISNQVLKLVDDFRNHPGSILIANGDPVVICCDDPSFWGAKALSYDFYITFMALANKNDDLRLLKQLAMNSIVYSALEKSQKDELMNLFNQKWDVFLDEILLGQTGVKSVSEACNSRCKKV